MSARHVSVAQLEEQDPPKVKVASSNLAGDASSLLSNQWVRSLMHTFIAVVAAAFVIGLAVYAVQALMGPWAWLAYVAAAFMAFMAGMAKLNEV